MENLACVRDGTFKDSLMLYFLINMCLVFVCMFCHKFLKGEIVNVIFCKLVTKGYYGYFICNMF